MSIAMSSSRRFPCYGDTSKQGMDETAPLAKYTGADAMKETSTTMRANNFALYGPLKALSEAEAEKWFPGKTLVIRPGYIVVPATNPIGLPTGRYAWNAAVSPGARHYRPTRFKSSNARDLAEWTIRMIEQGTTGKLQCRRAQIKVRHGRMLDVIRKTTNSDARFTWVDDKFLTSEKIIDDIPIWTSNSRGRKSVYSTMNINKAISKGLTFRSLSETTRATLEWFRKQPTSRQAKMRAGITAKREA